MSTDSVPLNRATVEIDSPMSPAAACTNTAPQPVRTCVHRALAALDSAGINTVVLRDYEQLTDIPRDGMELDLLVDPAALESMTAILRQHGFVYVPARGHSPHRFYVAYDGEHDIWSILDVVTDLRFGHPVRPLATDGLAGDFLAGAVQRSNARVLAPEHRFVKLLLSCLLNERQFSPAAQAELLQLNNELRCCAEAPQRIAATMDRLLNPALDWKVLQLALERHDFAALLKRRHAVWWQLFRRAPLQNALRWCGGVLARRYSPLLGSGSSGMLVALLGPDGAGKSTLARTLSRIPKLRTCTIYMGSVPPHSMFPFGLLGSLNARLQRLYTAQHAVPLSRPDRVLRKAQSLAYVAIQCLLMFLALYRRATGWVVIFDRYSYDSCIQGRPATLREKLLRAVSPAPDLILILDAPGRMLFARKKEHSPEYLERNRVAYRVLARELPHAMVLDASGDISLLRRQGRFALWSRYCEKN